MELSELLKNIKEPDKNIILQTQKILDNLTKPKDSLGFLEEIAKKVASIQGRKRPFIKKKILFVLAADHGIVEEKVSLYPKEVTKQMVLNFLSGGAAINVFARHTNTEIFVVDTGVDEDFKGLKKKNFINRKISYGTRNFAKYPAMRKEESLKAIKNGIELVEKVLNDYGDEIIIGIGDMGIGNTTSASAITSVITGYPVKKVTSRGTGIDEKLFQNKVNVIKKAIELHKPDPKDPLDILSKIGGFEIATSCGIILSCCKNKIPVVIDGFIITSSALLSFLFSPIVLNHIFAGHLTSELSHKLQLDFLNLRPIINLDMRLGEGTGACLGMSIIELSCKILNEMATFESAKVSKKIT